MVAIVVVLFFIFFSSHAWVSHCTSGDQFVGRTVAGLPIDSPEFGILPPYFKAEHGSSDMVDRAIKVCCFGCSYLCEILTRKHASPGALSPGAAPYGQNLGDVPC